MQKKKAVLAIYPTSKSIELAPRKVVAVDLKAHTITLEGPTPPELLAETEADRRRFDLNARLKGYAETCLQRVFPSLSRSQQQSLAKKPKRATLTKLPDSLPDDAPAEARDALLALQTIHRITNELARVQDWPDEMDLALCLAIDLGQLLQRGQTQVDHGENVAAGQRNRIARSEAVLVKIKNKQDRIEASRVEYIRRAKEINSPRRKTDILRKMSGETNADGSLKYYSFAKLKGIAKDW